MARAARAFVRYAERGTGTDPAGNEISVFRHRDVSGRERVTAALEVKLWRHHGGLCSEVMRADFEEIDGPALETGYKVKRALKTATTAAAAARRKIGERTAARVKATTRGDAAVSKRHRSRILSKK